MRTEIGLHKCRIKTHTWAKGKATEKKLHNYIWSAISMYPENVKSNEFICFSHSFPKLEVSSFPEWRREEMVLATFTNISHCFERKQDDSYGSPFMEMEKMLGWMSRWRVRWPQFIRGGPTLTRYQIPSPVISKPRHDMYYNVRIRQLC